MALQSINPANSNRVIVCKIKNTNFNMNTNLEIKTHPLFRKLEKKYNKGQKKLQKLTTTVQELKKIIDGRDSVINVLDKDLEKKIEQLKQYEGELVKLKESNQYQEQEIKMLEYQLNLEQEMCPKTPPRFPQPAIEPSTPTKPQEQRTTKRRKVNPRRRRILLTQTDADSTIITTQPINRETRESQEDGGCLPILTQLTIEE